MVLALANFYRISLSAGCDIIPVRDVIQMIQNYLYIQKLRMKDALNYTIACDPSLEDNLMPKGLLQPLLENALTHRLNSQNRPGELRVIFEKSSSKMRLTVADNGTATIDLATKQKPDIILSDISMPYISGLEMLETLRKNNINTEIIFITAYGKFEYAQEAIRYGAFDYILKPIDEKLLLSTVSRCAAKIRSEESGEE